MKRRWPKSGAGTDARSYWRDPLDDAATYRMLSQGEIGIFQLESSGMRNVLRELMPNKFADIVAVVALYRPGPMEQIPHLSTASTGGSQSIIPIRTWSPF